MDTKTITNKYIPLMMLKIGILNCIACNNLCVGALLRDSILLFLI